MPYLPWRENRAVARFSIAERGNESLSRPPGTSSRGLKREREGTHREAMGRVRVWQKPVLDHPHPVVAATRRRLPCVPEKYQSPRCERLSTAAARRGPEPVAPWQSIPWESEGQGRVFL